MTFKVGDKVRRTKGENESSPIGKEMVIRSIGPDMNGDLTYWFDGNAWGYAHGVHCAAWELVQTTGPVRTVTRREVVPGVYGNLKVSKTNGPYPHLGFSVGAGHEWPPAELRAAAAVLLELAGALDE